MLTLYQFPISHYCEKVRWALDYKGLDYQIVNLLPGAHIKIIKRMAPDTAVPVLVHDSKVIQNSSDIIDYLDNTFTEKPLTPKDPELKRQALEWEAYVDNKIGAQVRLYCYHYILDINDITLPMLTHNIPWYKTLVFRLFYKKVREIMRRFMKINDRTAAIAIKQVERAVDKLSTQLEANRFLVGDTFSRADLAAAALLAPLCRPANYDLNWPEQYPDELEQTVNKLTPKLLWVHTLYREYR